MFWAPVKTAVSCRCWNVSWSWLYQRPYIQKVFDSKTGLLALHLSESYQSPQSNFYTPGSTAGTAGAPKQWCKQGSGVWTNVDCVIILVTIQWGRTASDNKRDSWHRQQWANIAPSHFWPLSWSTLGYRHTMWVYTHLAALYQLVFGKSIFCMWRIYHVSICCY